MRTMPREIGLLFAFTYIIGVVLLMTAGIYDGPLAEPALLLVLVCVGLLAFLFARVVRVDPEGPACHTGAQSCFFDALKQAPPAPGETLAALERVLESRKDAPPPGSYTAKLFADEALRHKKVGEEAAELITASLRGKRDEIAHEAADLLYHAMVLLKAHGMGLKEVAEELRKRAVPTASAP